MFITQMLFEIKKTSKALIGVLLVLLLVTLAISVGHELIQPTYGRSFNPENTVLISTFAKNSSKKELKKDLLTKMKRDKKLCLRDLKVGSTKSGLLQSELIKEQRIVRFYNQAIPLLTANKYQQLNLLSSKLLSSHPDPTNYNLDIWSLGSGMTSHTHHSGDLFRVQQNAILKYAPTKVAAISVYSDALNLILPTVIGWGEYDTHSSPLASTMIIWIVGILLCASTFSTRRKNFNDTLSELAPLNNFRIYLAQSLAALIIFDGIILLAYTLIVLFIVVVPGHDLGSFSFPIVTSANGIFISNSITSLLAEALFYYTLWFIQLSGLAIILHQFTKSQVLIAFLLTIASFAQQLGILSLLPEASAAVTPAHFINLPQLMLHFAPFESVTMTSFAAIAVTWTSLTMSLSIIISRLRHSVNYQNAQGLR